MVDIAQGELEQLVGEDAGGVGKAKQGVVGEDGADAHGAGVQRGLPAHAAQGGVAVDDVDVLADDDVAEDWEEGEDGGQGGGAVDDPEGHVVDLEAVGQVAHALAVFVGVRDDDDLVAAVDEALRQLVDVALDAAGLREEEVADHGDVVRGRARGHLGLVSSRLVLSCLFSHLRMDEDESRVISCGRSDMGSGWWWVRNCCCGGGGVWNSQGPVRTQAVDGR